MAAPTPATITLDVNNSGPTTITVPDGSIPLLYVLRDHFGLKGPKFGCGFAQCGACEVNLLGLAARSCQATIDLLLQILALFIRPSSRTSRSRSRRWKALERLTTRTRFKRHFSTSKPASAPTAPMQ